MLTDVGGNPELVRRDVDGLLAPRGDVDGIAAGFRERCSPIRRSRLGSATARRSACGSEFLLDRTIERYYELYRALAPSHQ